MMKMKKYEITTEEYEAVVKTRKATQNKRIARRLRVIELRYEGKTSKEIAEKLSVKVSTGSAQKKKGAQKRPCKHLFFARSESIFNQI